MTQFSSIPVQGRCQDLIAAEAPAAARLLGQVAEVGSAAGRGLSTLSDGIRRRLEPAAPDGCDAFPAALDEPPTAPPRCAVRQRGLATVVFTDIVRSTEHAAELGDRRWRRVMEDQQRLVRERLQRHGGQEVKTTGDGFLLRFDRPTPGVEFAGSVVADLPALGFEVRAGAHTGEVELMGADIGGIGVHVAARICALASGGEVLVSRTVHDLAVGSSLNFEPRGRHRLRGVPEEWDLYEARVDAAAEADELSRGGACATPAQAGPGLCDDLRSGDSVVAREG
jgi:class 3 adenylate cyclase